MNITAKLILGSESLQKNVFLNVTGLLANSICVSYCDNVLWLHNNAFVSSGVLKCCHCKHAGWFATNYDVMKFFCCWKLWLIQFNQLLLALTYLPFWIASHATFYIYSKSIQLPYTGLVYWEDLQVLVSFVQSLTCSESCFLVLRPM